MSKAAEKAMVPYVKQAYAALVLGRGSFASAVDGLATAASQDPDLLAAARAELARCSGLDNQRCFASLQTSKLMAAAIAKVDAGPG